MEEKNVGKHFFPSPKPGTNKKTKQYLRKFTIYGNPILYLTFIFVVKLRSRSRSSPGPFLVLFRSILSHSNLFQFKIRLSGPGADAIFTVPPQNHPPTYQETFL